MSTSKSPSLVRSDSLSLPAETAETHAAGRVPAALSLIRDFVNTRKILATNPYARERLESPAALDDWWRDRAGWTWATRSGTAELAATRTAREGFRGLLAHNNDCIQPEDHAAIAALDALAASMPLRVAISPEGGTRIVPLKAGSALDAIAVLLAEMAQAATGDSWHRLKICRDPNCREAFYDTSRNASRSWCSMEVCGSRAKQRAFTARQRASKP